MKENVFRRMVILTFITLTLLFQSAAVFAVAPPPPPPTYTLTVNNGSGDGAYPADAAINIVADAAPAGQVFDRWEVVSGGARIASVRVASTTVTMPSNNATVTATYIEPQPLDFSCHPYSLSTCAMPYPNDLFTPEEMTATFSEDLLSQLPESLFPTTILKDRDGWSPVTAVLFEVPYKINECALPLNGDNVLKVFDMDDPYAPPVPVRVRLSQPAEVEKQNWQILNPGAKTHQVIEAFPRSRFPFGHRMAAVLTTALKAADGTIPTAPEIPEAYEGLAYELAGRGVDPGTILSLTEFTIATEENTTGKLFDMIDVIENQGHPVKDLKIERWLGLDVDTVVRGKVRLTSFRDLNGDGMVHFEAGDTGKEYWADFDLFFPSEADWGSVPVCIYGHGLDGDKETAVVFAELNADEGIATLAIDWPNHGTRSSKDGGQMKTLFAPETVSFITGMAVQGVLDFHSVMAAIRGSLADLDVMPPHEWYNSLRPGYGRPDIDTDRIYYMGTSLGGVFGSGYVGSATGLDGAFLQVSGVGIMRTLALSGLYESMGFYKMVPMGATPSETALLFNYVQNIVDVADGANLIHNIQDPNVGGQKTPLVVQYGLHDSIVHNDSSEAMAEIAGLKQVPPVWRDLAYIPNTCDDDAPFALVQGTWPVPSIEVLGLDLAMIQHISFLTPSALYYYENWLANIK